MHATRSDGIKLETIFEFMTPEGILVSDNTHCCSALSDFCQEKGWRYYYVPERSRGHFYPGAGIGMARRDS
ncbi:MAG: hypothetical protein D6679_09050 [Candidatus Hydrogenedentota bacterium]|nr:MAG: hypothetical protein D6679_09050 [Candidatus Hydrogenedentota bacterium]